MDEDNNPYCWPDPRYGESLETYSNTADGGPAGAQSATRAPHRPCTQKACEGYRLDAVLHFTKRDMDTAYQVKQWLGIRVMLDRQGHRCSARAELLCNMPGSSNEIQALKVAEKMTSTFIILRTPRFEDDSSALRIEECIQNLFIHKRNLRVMQMIVGRASHRSVDNEGAFFFSTFDFQPDSASFQRHMADKLSTCTDLHKRYRMLSERRPNSGSLKQRRKSVPQRNRKRFNRKRFNTIQASASQEQQHGKQDKESDSEENGEAASPEQDDGVAFNAACDIKQKTGDYQNDPQCKDTDTDEHTCSYNDSLNASSDTWKPRPYLLPQTDETSAKQVQDVHTRARSPTIPSVSSAQKIIVQTNRNENTKVRTTKFVQPERKWSMSSVSTVSECSVIVKEVCRAGAGSPMNNLLGYPTVHRGDLASTDCKEKSTLTVTRDSWTGSIKASPTARRKYIQQEQQEEYRTQPVFNDNLIFLGQTASSIDDSSLDCEYHVYRDARSGTAQEKHNTNHIRGHTDTGDIYMNDGFSGECPFPSEDQDRRSTSDSDSSSTADTDPSYVSISESEDFLDKLLPPAPPPKPARPTPPTPATDTPTTDEGSCDQRPQRRSFSILRLLLCCSGSDPR